MVDKLRIDRQAGIVGIQGSQQIVTAHGGFPHKVNVRNVDLVNVQAAILAAQGFFPARFVGIAHHIDLAVAAWGVQQQMGQAVLAAAARPVFNQVAEVIQHAQLLGDDVLFNRALVQPRQHMQPLWAGRAPQDELEQPHGGFARCGGALQKFHRRRAAQECLVFFGQQQISHPAHPAVPVPCPAGRYPAGRLV